MCAIGISSEGELGMLHCSCAVMLAMLRAVLKISSIMLTICSCKRFVLKISLLVPW